MAESPLANLKNLLPSALSRHGLGERVRAAQVVTEAEKLLRQLLTADQCLDVQVVSYQQECLHLRCQHPGVRYVLERHSQELKQQLEVCFPEISVKRIDIAVGPALKSDEEWYTN
jgi:hypothetical protein